MHMSLEVKERIAGTVFLSIMSISVSFILILLLVLLVTGWSGVQEHIGECVIASAILSLGWFHQLSN